MTTESKADVKPPQTGLVDMGNPSFYDEPGTLPTFNILDLYPYPGSFSEIVLNVTWAELQPTPNGPLNTAPINSAIAAVQFYNWLHGTDVGIKLRVWGGYTAPEWAKCIDGPAITITGPGLVDPGSTTPETIGRFWTADYINAWTSFQTELAATYDSNPMLRGISNTAGASASDEPFSQVYLSQMPELQAGGYNDAAEELTLRAGIADYSAWGTTPLDYTMSVFRLENADKATPDPNFSLAVLQEAENSSRSVQAGNHALNSPLPSWAVFLYAQIAADAALNPATVPASYQTDAPASLGPYSNWPNVIAQGAATGAGDIELWDTPFFQGFESKSPASVAALATILANGVAPQSGAPDDGKALEFIAPSLVIGVPGTIVFSGTDAVLLSSATSATTYTVTVTSAGGNTLTAIENRQLLSGKTLTFSGSLGEVNRILANLTDRVAGGSDTLTCTANDDEGHSVTQIVGVVASAGAAAATAASGVASQSDTAVVATDAWGGAGIDQLLSNNANSLPSGSSPGGTATAQFSTNADLATVAGTGVPGTVVVNTVVSLPGGSDFTVGQAGSGDVEIASQPGTSGTLVVAGVNTSLSVAGNLDVGGTATSAGGNGALLAALSPDAYSTAGLAIAGTLNVWSEGTVRVSGALAPASVSIANGGTISGDGLLAPYPGNAIVNDGVIEAASDQTLGLAQLSVVAPITGTGEILIDAGANLTLASSVTAGQTVVFSAPTSGQLSNGPYSPTSLALEKPYAFHGAITGFSFADNLVLDGVNASRASYSSGTLTVNPANGGAPLTVKLSGELTGLKPLATESSSGGAAVTTITFVAPGTGASPSVVVPAALETAPGIAVPVPDIVLNAPFPASPPSDTAITVTVSTGNGALAVATGADDAAVTQQNPELLTLTGTLDAVERSLESLTYTGAAAGADEINLSASDYGGSSPPATIAVFNGNAGTSYTWGSSAGGAFADPTQWTTGGSHASGAPGGADVASFGPGAYTVTGDGAVGEITVGGNLTLTGRVSAQGLASSGTAVSVQSGGALTLAGGAVLTAATTAFVGTNGNDSLTVMGGALNLTGPANGLVIGETAGDVGTVLDLEQITDAGSLVVGAAGSGTLQLLGVAASASDITADIAEAPGSNGGATVNGGEWTTSGSLTVGDAGAGLLLIDGAANGVTGQVTAFNSSIGSQTEGTGTITVADGDLLVANETAASSTLTVGDAGTGTLAVSDGGNVTVGAAFAVVSNSSTVFNTGTLIVGDAASSSGLITIATGASVEIDGSSVVGQSGAGAVTVGNNGADSGLFAMTGSLTVGADGNVTLAGSGALVRASAVTIAYGGLLEGTGTVSGDGGGNDTVMLTSIANDGTIAANGGSLLIYGSVAGTGTLTAMNGASLTLQAAVAPRQILQFGQNAEATLSDVGAFHGTIDGFSAGDTLTLGSLPWSTSETATLDAGNLLTISDGNQVYQLQFDPMQDFAGETLELSAAGSWGTNVTLTGSPTPTITGGGIWIATAREAPGFLHQDMTTGAGEVASGDAYGGSEPGLWAEYLDNSTDHAVIEAEEPDAFILAGTGMNAVEVASGDNGLATQGNAVWFAGGTGKDTFFAAAGNSKPSWTTILNLVSGDKAPLWGLIPDASSYPWGASNEPPQHQGLMPESIGATGVPADVTLAGFGTSDLGRIGGTRGAIGGQDYLPVHHF